MLLMTKTLSPPSKPSRVSVPVSADVLETFQKLAKAGNMSTGRAMAEWLQDTMDAAKYTAMKMEEARQAPRLVARELHSYALGLADETGSLIASIQNKGRGLPKGAGRQPTAAPATAGKQSPPSCNTGGKVSGASGSRRKGSSS